MLLGFKCAHGSGAAELVEETQFFHEQSGQSKVKEK